MGTPETKELSPDEVASNKVAAQVFYLTVLGTVLFAGGVYIFIFN